jgi:hypothetical protein
MTTGEDGEVRWDIDRESDAVIDPALRDAIGELASGALVMWGEGTCRLVRHLPQPPHHVFDVLIHRGWVEDLANGSGYRISEAGKLAYLRSTDELRDGKLVHPEGWTP